MSCHSKLKYFRSTALHNSYWIIKIIDICTDCSAIKIAYWQFSSIYARFLTLHSSWKFYKAYTTLAFETDSPNFIRSFIADGYYNVRLGNQLSDNQKLTKGIPQGHVFSSALFKFCINDSSTDILSSVSAPCLWTIWVFSRRTQISLTTSTEY